MSLRETPVLPKQRSAFLIKTDAHVTYLDPDLWQRGWNFVHSSGKHQMVLHHDRALHLAGADLCLSYQSDDPATPSGLTTMENPGSRGPLVQQIVGCGYIWQGLSDPGA